MLEVPGDLRISAAVMTHPGRLDGARRLRERCGVLAPRIVLDPEPAGTPSAWRTARAAWAAHEPDATHHLVLQDDAILADNFTEALAAAVTAHPTDAIALFVEWGSRTAGAIRIAAASGAGWVECADDYVPCVALVLPIEHAAAFDGFAARTSSELVPDDVVLLDFFRERGIRAIAPVQGMVDHDRLRSLVGNRIMGLRRSVRYRAVWSDTGSVRLAASPLAIPYYDWWDQQAAMFAPDEASADGWTRLRSGPAFEYLGADVHVADQTFEDIEPGLADRTRDLVSGIILREIWKTGFLLGFIVGTDRGDLAHGAFVDASGTIVPGGLRRIVPVHLLDEVTELLHRFVLDAAAAGAAHQWAAAHADARETEAVR